MTAKQKLIIAGTAIMITAPAALVLGQKISDRIKMARTAKNEFPATN